MTDNNLGTHLLALYVQLTPWVQAFLAFTACVLVLGVAFLFKETVAALTHPFIRPPPGGEIRALPGGPPKEAPRRITGKMAREIHDD